MKILPQQLEKKQAGLLARPALYFSQSRDLSAIRTG
jgi:hypothetical protein